MPVRGSVQLLLLSPRWRVPLRIGVGAATAGIIILGAVQLQNALPVLGEDGLAQALRQNVWKRALSDRVPATPWPWQDVSTSMSLAPGAAVPRLGLSAALRDQTTAEPVLPGRENDTRIKTAEDSQPQGDVALSDVNIGDNITFTAADGATCVYRVTGRRVVDPHLAASEAQGLDVDASLFECSPLESLIRQATQGTAQGEPRAPVGPRADQQKL